MRGRMLGLAVIGLASCTVVEDEDGKKRFELDRGDPQDWIDPVEYHLAATTTASWLARIGYAWVTDGGHPCAVLADDLSLTVTPGPMCPHPLLDGLTGSARLGLDAAGSFIFSGSVEDLTVGGRPLLAQIFPMLQVAPTPGGLEVVVTIADYGDDQVLTWLVSAQMAGTPDLADDTIDIEGGSSAVETLPDEYRPGDPNVTLSGSLLITPECRRNPVTGSVMVAFSTPWPQPWGVRGQETCDGTITIDGLDQPAEWTPTLDLLRGQ